MIHRALGWAHLCCWEDRQQWEGKGKELGSGCFSWTQRPREVLEFAKKIWGIAVTNRTPHSPKVCAEGREASWRRYLAVASPSFRGQEMALQACSSAAAKHTA